MPDSGQRFNTQQVEPKQVVKTAPSAPGGKESIEREGASVRAFCEQIKKDAQQEIERILGRAELSASRKNEEAQQEAAAIARQIREAAEAQAKEIEARTTSGLFLEMRKTLLKAQGEIIDEVLGKVRARLKELRGSREYCDFLKGLALHGILALGEEECVLAPGSEDRELFSSQLVQDIRQSVERRAGRKVMLSISHDLSIEGGGIRLYSGGMRMLFDNTLDARLERLADELKDIVAREVFASERAAASGRERKEESSFA